MTNFGEMAGSVLMLRARNAVYPLDSSGSNPSLHARTP